MALPGEAVLAFLLYLTVSLTEADISLPLETLVTTKGNSVKPWCDVTGGETFIGWYDPKGSKITSDTSQRKHVESDGTRHYLSLQTIDPASDGGVYECRGDTNKRTLTLKVNFAVNPAPIQKLSLDKQGIVRLDAYGYPKPNFEWKKDGVLLDIASQPRFAQLEDGSLQISQVKVADEGKYDCRITQGVALQDVSIQVSVIQKPQFVVRPQAARDLTEGYNTTFKCSAIGRPQPTIKWIDQNGRIIDKLVDNRFSISDGHLTITGVTKSDAARTYICQATNNVGQDTANAKITKVWALTKLRPVGDLNVVLEEKATLDCVATDGDEPISVVWKKDGNNLRDQQQTSGRSTVVFESAQVENTGRYVCEATMGAVDEKGNKILTKEEVFLSVTSPPKLNEKKSKTPLYSSVGSLKPVRIVCEFLGYPSPNITITKNGVELAEGKTMVSYKIDNIKQSSFGAYLCSAINKNGKANHTIELRRAEPLIITVPPRSTRELTAGYNTTFRCDATGYPAPTIKWVDQNGSTIDYLADKRFSVSSGFLTITGVKSADANIVFTCEATNEILTVKSCAAKITRVFVLPKLNPVNDVYKNFSDKAVLTCSASGGEPMPSVVWMRNGFVVQNQKQETNRTSITFEKVDRGDMGKYVCEALNGARDENNKLIVVREEAHLFVDPSKPDKPSSVEMTASCNSVTLRWIEPVSDGGLPVTKYSIQMKDDIGAVVYSGTVIPPATTYRHVNNIKRQACYHVEVRAHNAFDKSEAVDVSVTTKSFCPPGSPNITAPIDKTLQTTYMVLKWNKPADNGGDASLRYRVVITEVSGSKAEAKAVSFSGLTDTQHTVTELLPGVRYKLQVFAVNKAGEGQAAEEHYFVAVDAQGQSRAHALATNPVLVIAGALAMLVTVSVF